MLNKISLSYTLSHSPQNVTFSFWYCNATYFWVSLEKNLAMSHLPPSMGQVWQPMTFLPHMKKIHADIWNAVCVLHRLKFRIILKFSLPRGVCPGFLETDLVGLQTSVLRFLPPLVTRPIFRPDLWLTRTSGARVPYPGRSCPMCRGCSSWLHHEATLPLTCTLSRF